MRVYAVARDPTLCGAVSRQENDSQTRRSVADMTRRPLVLLALAISSFVLAACSDMSTAPRRDSSTSDSTGTCFSGYMGGAGRC